MSGILMSDLMDFLEVNYPLSDAMTWDHVGLQIGQPSKEIKNIFTTLDVTPEVVDYAIQNNFDTIVSHHPLLFHPIKSLDFSVLRNQMYQKIINHGFNIYSMHTNVDVGEPGMNDWLAELLELENVAQICSVKTCQGTKMMGRMGETKLQIDEIIAIFKDKLKINVIKYLDNGKEINKIGILGGAGAEFIEAAFNAGVDLFITGDVKYHDFLDSQISHYAVLDVGHVVEKIFAGKIAELIRNNLDVNVEANLLTEMEIRGLEEK